MSESYNVVWSIDVDANTPRQAAEIARDIQRDPDSKVSSSFAVEDDQNTIHYIDLLEPDFMEGR